jgi:predicted metal-dependent HD superfamily phosphohydrolase
MLDTLRQCTIDSRYHLTIDDTVLVQYLVLYHDVFYKVGLPRGENELLSAEWAINDFLKSRVKHKTQTCALLEQGIMATINHSLESVDHNHKPVVALLLDLDLWGLGASEDEFKMNTDRIWREQEPMCSYSQFQTGQIMWAQTLLDRPAIYHTSIGRDREAQARLNLERLARQASVSTVAFAP